MNNNLERDTKNRKFLSLAAHASILSSSTIITLLIPFSILYLSDDEIVRKNAKEAINFCLNIYILALIFMLLIFVIIGFPLLFLLVVANILLPLIAIVKIFKNPNYVYRYPFIWRFI